MTLVMHHHIFKNAGSTVDWILHHNFPENGVLNVEGERADARLLPWQITRVAAEYPEHRCVTSHCAPLPAPEGQWADVHVVLLRDPLRRMYSMYRFAQRRTDDAPYVKLAREKDFRAYCSFWLERPGGPWRAWQTKCCTPQTPDTLLRHRGWFADVEAAAQALSETQVVGTVERFDESMVLLECRLRDVGEQFDASFVRQNTASDRGEETDLPALLRPTLFSQFLERNATDYALLDNADRLLSASLRALDPDGGSLADLQRRCEALRQKPPRVRVTDQSEWHLVEDAPELKQAIENSGKAM